MPRHDGHGSWWARMRVVLAIAWIIACCAAIAPLRAFFIESQAPARARVGMLVRLPMDAPATPQVVVRRVGEAWEHAQRVTPLVAEHPESTWQHLLVTPGGPRLRILRVETERWGLDLGAIAHRTPGWRVLDDGSIATETGAPIIINAWALRLAPVFATGPDAGTITIRHIAHGAHATLDLASAEPGERRWGAVGPREPLLAFDPPTLDASMEFRVIAGEHVALLERVWTTHGGVTLLGDGASARWHPPPTPPLPHAAATLAALLCAAAFAAWPLLLRLRARRCSHEAGVAIAIVLWSMGYAGLLMLLYSPGIAEPDAITRIMHVGAIWEGTPIPAWARVHWFPPGKSMAMLLSHIVTGGQAWLSFLCAWWTLASIGLLALVACGPRRAPVVLLLCMLMPNIATHAAAMLPDAPTTAALCTMAALLLWLRRDGATLGRWQLTLATGAWLLSALVLFTFRANAIVSIIVVVPACWWALRWVSRTRAQAWIAMCVASVGIAMALPRLVPWQRLDTASASLIWEHVGMLSLAQDDALTARHTLDDLGRAPRATRTALATFDWITHDTLVWGPDSAFVRELVADRRFRVRERWWALVRERPDLYVRCKWEVLKTMLGTRHVVPLGVWVPWRIGWETSYGMDVLPDALLAGEGEEISRRTSPRPAWNAWSVTTWVAGQWRVLMPLYLPYVWIALTAALMIACLVRRRALAAHAVLLVLFAFASYGAYMILTPGVHWRYFMPAFVLCIIASAAMARDLVSPASSSRRSA